MKEENVLRFMSLYRGNGRSYGKFKPNMPSSRHSETIKEQVSREQYEQHLNGVLGLGIVPIMDDDHCWFGAIDIDAHGDAEDIDLVELEKAVRDNDFPLTVCRSKSGGAHLYLYGSEPLRANLVRSTLAKWATILGHRGVEIFPKQEHLPTSKDDKGNDSKQLGNWLNLAWFDAENPECLRYTVEGGKRIDFEHFLDVAESRRIPNTALLAKAESQHMEAPPCIQRMMAEGVGKGHRNEAMYNTVIYLKKAFPESWRDKAFDVNVKMFTEPMSHAEAKKVIDSASRRDYRYKCKEEPCRSLCNSFQCVQRKFGITPDEKGEMDMGKPPEFGPLEKYMTTPVRWALRVDGVRLNLTTQQLMDFKQIREAIADNLTKLVPPMKNDRWQAQLFKLMEEAVLLEAPEEATQEGLLRSRLRQFLSKTDLESPGDDTADRDALMYGSPVVQLDSDKRRVVYFRGQDFLDYLKKQRIDDIKGPSLWVILKQQGLGNSKLRVGNQSINVWSWPLEDMGVTEIPAKEIKSEF